MIFRVWVRCRSAFEQSTGAVELLVAHRSARCCAPLIIQGWWRYCCMVCRSVGKLIIHNINESHINIYILFMIRINDLYSQSSLHFISLNYYYVFRYIKSGPQNNYLFAIGLIHGRHFDTCATNNINSTNNINGCDLSKITACHQRNAPYLHNQAAKIWEYLTYFLNKLT